MTVIDHNHPESIRLRNGLGLNRYNGAYYYSLEIGRYFIPNIRTDRNWMTIRAGEACLPHSIVFVHDLFNFDRKYGYTFGYEDMLYVVGVPDMLDDVKRHGKGIYLPLSIDTEYVKQFRREKDREACFAGRREWRDGSTLSKGVKLPAGIDYVEMLPREQFLTEMARYRIVYAETRSMIEARVLGCEARHYHPRFKGTDVGDVLDSLQAAEILQGLLDEVDGG